MTLFWIQVWRLEVSPTAAGNEFRCFMAVPLSGEVETDVLRLQSLSPGRAVPLIAEFLPFVDGPGPVTAARPSRSSPTGTPPAGHTNPQSWRSGHRRGPSPRGSLRTRRLVRRVLRHEEGRWLFQELPIHPQLSVFCPQPLQLGPLTEVHRQRRFIQPSPLLEPPRCVRRPSSLRLQRFLGPRW